MKGDIASLEDTGGESARPEVLRLDSQGEQLRSSKDQPKKFAPDEEEFQIPGYAGAGESVFSPTQKAPSAQSEKPKTKRSMKIAILVGGLVVVAAGAGALGYFVVWPLFFPQDEAVVATPTPTPPPEETPAPTPEPTPTPRAHVSAFLASPEITAEAVFAAVSPSAVLSAASQRAAQLKNGEMMELILFDSDRQPVNFSDLMLAFYPPYSSEQFGIFSEDFTLFVYKAQDRLYPGFLARLREPELTLVAGQTFVRRLESPELAPQLKNIFPENPGNADIAGFKDGKAGALQTRYVTFEQPGAALNYGLDSTGLFALSTSYAGLLKAMQLTQVPTPSPTP